MERVKGAGTNGVTSVRLLLMGWPTSGLFIPRRRFAIISRATSIRLFFVFMTNSSWNI
jgi:hypothetical protein